MSDAGVIGVIPVESGDLLLDRMSGRGQIDRVLESAARGLGAVLVMHGEAGTGKTALLNYAIDSAGNLDFARLVGVESGAGLGFAARHPLLAPFLGRLSPLLAPQRQALATPFGLRDGHPTDRLLIGLASVVLLSGVATAVVHSSSLPTTPDDLPARQGHETKAIDYA